jgi:serine/threonine protein kinase
LATQACLFKRVLSTSLWADIKADDLQYNYCFVEFLGWFEDSQNVFIAMEYFPHGDLQDHLSEPLPESDVQQITSQILEGLSHMHENGFAHRDLKPSNILVKSRGPNWWVKIGDFGISKRAGEGLTALRTLHGTLGFIAPEILVQTGLLDDHGLSGLQEYTSAVDIWSLGEIVFRALTNCAPFSTNLASYIKGNSLFPHDILQAQGTSDEGCDLVKSLLQPIPADRPTAKETLKHPWASPQTLRELIKPQRYNLNPYN